MPFTSFTYFTVCLVVAAGDKRATLQPVLHIHNVDASKDNLESLKQLMGDSKLSDGDDIDSWKVDPNSPGNATVHVVYKDSNGICQQYLMPSLQYIITVWLYIVHKSTLVKNSKSNRD